MFSFEGKRGFFQLKVIQIIFTVPTLTLVSTGPENSPSQPAGEGLQCHFGAVLGTPPPHCVTVHCAHLLNPYNNQIRAHSHPSLEISPSQRQNQDFFKAMVTDNSDDQVSLGGEKLT